MRSSVDTAARKIWKCWKSFRNRRIFAYLRHAVCRAEDSLTHQVLRKISPLEASVLRDPTLNARLRFRFGGSNFPPLILYKIFINANVQYIAGTNRILAGSRAAEDACDLMGERKYFDIVLSDVENCTPLTDAVLVQDDLSLQTRLKEHSMLDSHAVWLGGRGNGWRVLIDDRFIINENVLRFAPSRDVQSGKYEKIMDSILTGLEKSIASQHVHAAVPLKKKFASKDTLDRIHVTHQRVRSQEMRKLYSSHLRKNESVERTHDSQHRHEVRGGEEEAQGRGSLSGDEILDDDSLETATESLLDWAGELSFEKYHEAWERTAATIMPRFDVPLTGSP
mmetsp:Transcript_12583/g.28911  ORF Transcript_12583/g.28911 Transcript_12583/m.28911 type:complete len:337 (-) Transcript_12583:2407-3417(-)|eukprot:750291-Hanusia_phi.AAC.1